VAVVVALAILSLLVMAGLAIDTGHLVLNKSRLQSTVDAAALAGAKKLHGDHSTTAVAITEARDVFMDNATKFNELSTANRDAVIVEFSSTLNPFVPGSEPAKFVRVRYEIFSMWTSFTRLVGFDEMTTRASAVAGPSAPITAPCGLFPVAVCAVKDSTAPHWGYPPYPSASSTVIAMRPAAGSNPTDIGPGNYHLLNLGGTGGANLGDGLAGGAACATQGGMADVDTQTGLVVGQVAAGVNTRFGLYKGSLKGGGETFPPDRIVRTRPGSSVPDMPLEIDEDGNITYDGEPLTGLGDVEYSYAHYLADSLSQNWTHDPKTGSPKGKADRRIVVIPIVDCTNPITGSSANAPVKGFACFFLLQPVEHTGSGAIFGEFVEPCEAEGSPGQGGGSGPYKIILHDDPGSTDS
jgi:hypothetical protein